MEKLLLLTLNEQEEKAIDKIIAAISDCLSLEAVQTIPVPTPGMSFPGGNGYFLSAPQNAPELPLKRFL